MLTEKNGEQYEFWLDIEKAIDIEREKGVNVLDIIDALQVPEGKNPSFMAMDDACSVILGMSLPALIKAGFSLKEIIGEGGLLITVIQEADFISALKDGATSSGDVPKEEAQPTASE